MLSTTSLTIQNTILYYDLLRHAHRTCTKISKNTKAFAISSQKLNHFFKAYLAFLKMDPVGCSLALSCNPPCWFSLRFLPSNQDGISSKDPANSRLTISKQLATATCNFTKGMASSSGEPCSKDAIPPLQWEKLTIS